MNGSKTLKICCYIQHLSLWSYLIFSEVARRIKHYINTAVTMCVDSCITLIVSPSGNQDAVSEAGYQR